MDLKGLNAQNAKVKDREFVEEILHSYIPLIENKEEK